MYLKEFDLDFPYISDDERIQLIMNEKKCQYNDATKLDYELNWKVKRRSLRLETRCITAMYERLFGKLKTEDFWKILVECAEDITDERIMNYSGVSTVQVKFRFEDFSLKSEIDKKRTTLILLMEGIEKISLSKNWDIEPFRVVASQIEELGYLNEWVWKKAVKSPDKNFSAKVMCHHTVENMDIFISIMQRNGTEILLKKVLSELPDEFAYSKHLGELKWISDFEVALINKKGDGMVSVTLNSIN
ncbi:hypothetical protein [Paenibacillus sp. NPDC058174]|uniref:hypothetical protein n=1 Tax=Paenibacillus sp. NPDC058174 TaxID=3346366 RepID=UPI0036D79D0D